MLFRSISDRELGRSYVWCLYKFYLFPAVEKVEQRLASRLDKMSRREYQTERRRISVWTKCPNVDNRMERDYVEKNTKILLVS